jgi:hypothetical protein
MNRRSRRIDRKLHDWWLGLGVIDLSQDAGWRRRLFAAPLHQEFSVDARHTEGLFDRVAYAVRRYRLRYTVCRVPREETGFEPWWEGHVFFRVRALRYPDIVNHTANNPDSI